MGVLVEPINKVDLDIKSCKLEQAKESFEDGNIADCITSMSQGLDELAKQLTKKPQSKDIRKQIHSYWDFLASTSTVACLVERGFSPVNKAFKSNMFRILKSFITDSLIESEWEKQCMGKFGGPKPMECTWKEWYHMNEDQVDSFSSFHDVFKWASDMGHFQYVQSLLHENEADELDVNKMLYDYNTPLISRVIDKNSVDMIFCILELSPKLSIVDDYGWTPLHYAVHRGNMRVIKELIKMRASLNTKDKKGRTPLHIAVANDNMDVVKCLLSEGAKLNFKDSSGLLPIHYALYIDNTSLIKLLIEHGSDIGVKDVFGRSLAHLLVLQNKCYLLEFFIEEGLKLNSKDKFGRTPAHDAAYFGRSNCLDLLIKHGANTKSVDHFNQTPLICAASMGNTMEITMLNDMGIKVRP